MSQTRPFRQDVNWIQGDTLQYQFTFNEDDSALDLSGKSEITVILRNRNSTIFTHTLTGGEITLSGAGNNIISGTASATVMDIAARNYDLIIYFDNSIKETYVMFDVTIFNENSELNSSASEWTIDIDTSAGTVTGQATQQIINPNGVILVDGLYTENSGTKYDDIDLAITAARARIADDWDKAVIKAYLDTNGAPIGLGDNDYYDLQDEGIYFESEFDRWDDYVTKGGTLLQSDLLYDIKQSELSIDING